MKSNASFFRLIFLKELLCFQNSPIIMQTKTEVILNDVHF